MKLLSVNVGLPRDVSNHERTFTTGIFKNAVNGRVRVHTLHLEGDGQADLKVHGGVDMAVYVYPREHYAHWENELNRQDFVPGQFGENLTTSGLLENEVRIGDVVAIGTARFEVTQPRVPCFKLAKRMEAPLFPKMFLESQRTGFYLRVLQEGEIGAGDEISRVSTDPQQMTVREVFDVAYGEGGQPVMYQRAFEMPALSKDWRRMFAEKVGQTAAI